MNLNELYQLADDENIEVLSVDTKQEKSISIRADSGNCYVAINPLMINSEQQEREYLAHELGHCETGAFYSRYSPLSSRGQMEYRATLWQIKKLIPKNEFNEALKSGIIELWELAEHFEVSEDLMKKAIKYYIQYA